MNNDDVKKAESKLRNLWATKCEVVNTLRKKEIELSNVQANVNNLLKQIESIEEQTIPAHDAWIKARDAAQSISQG